MSGKNNESLEHAWRVQADASALGFDWRDISGPIAKVHEECAEIEAALLEGNVEGAQDELGDLLFAAINVARFLNVDPDLALEKTTARFKRRFALVKEAVAKDGKDMYELSIEALDMYWEQAKKTLQAENKK